MTTKNIVKTSGFIRLFIIVLFVALSWQIVKNMFFKEESEVLLESALCDAGNNRKELEKVLDYFQKDPDDSLKYKAACFLIRYIPYRYSYAPNSIIDSLKNLKVKYKGRWIPHDIREKWKLFHYETLPKVRDIDVITSDLLIENIDYAFKAWNKRAWSKYYTFEEFCEYILPYRLEDEPLEKWRKIYYERYNSVLDSLYQGTDVVEAAQKVAAYLQSEGFYNRIDFQLPHLGALFLLENRVGYCRDGCDVTSYVMRALGIPVSMDQYYISPSYKSRHFWSAVIDTTGLDVPFNYYETLPQRGMNNERKRGKVYRQFFGIQEKDIDIVNDSNVPELFRNPFWVDVTERYYPDSGFNIAIESGESTDKYVYLSVYDYDRYIPIDIAIINGKRATFKNVEKDLVYQPVYYRNGKSFPAGYPFFLEEGAVPSYFIPDTLNTHDGVLTRKYPIRYTGRFLSTAVGLKFECSQTLDFKNPRLLYEVVDTPQINYNKIQFSRLYPCRYIRVTQKDKRIEIAELEIYAKDRKISIQNWGRKRNKMYKSSYEKRMFDGKWESYIVINNDSLFLDIGKIESLSGMIFLPRNDDNFIHLGDTYELFYHNGVKDWVSLGKTVADATYLYYRNIPENSLLWLHNSTRGKEERPFYMKNGRQVFP